MESPSGSSTMCRHIAHCYRRYRRHQISPCRRARLGYNGVSNLAVPEDRKRLYAWLTRLQLSPSEVTKWQDDFDELLDKLMFDSTLPISAFRLKIGEGCPIANKHKTAALARAEQLALDHDAYLTGEWRQTHNQFFVDHNVVRSKMLPPALVLDSAAYKCLTPRMKEVLHYWLAKSPESEVRVVLARATSTSNNTNPESRCLSLSACAGRLLTSHNPSTGS